MLNLKQGTTAIVLVASLGMIVPGSFGGQVAADVNSARHHNPNGAVPMGATTYFFHCDLDGDAIPAPEDLELYETKYELDSTFNSMARHVQSGNLVLMRRQQIDILDSWYEVVDPESTSPDVYDPDVYWYEGPEEYPQGGGKPNGWKTVRCTSIASDYYTANADDVLLGLGFVEGELYIEYDLKLWDVTLSQAGKRVSADSADDAPSADRAPAAKKQGKHRGKGKRGR
jgi:hypothetical protein